MSIFEELRSTIVSQGPGETAATAERFAAALPPDATVCLQGVLGSGKTTFVRGMARAWRIADPVTSPTYNIFNIYQGTRQLLHCDAFRLNDPGEMETLMIEEFLRSPYCLVVEWPEHAAAFLSEKRWTLQLCCKSEQLRTITLLPDPAT